MTLGSGAHIQLGTFTDGAAAQSPLELMLAEDVEPHYNHRLEQTLSGRQDIAGEAGKYQTNPGRLYWSMTDWIGGEGVHTWTPNDPPVYSYSDGANTRRKGQFTGRPDRVSTTGIPAKATTSARPIYLSMGGGRLWFGAEEKVAFSADYGTSFTAITGTTGIDAGERVTAMAGDSRYIYVCSGNTAGTTKEIARWDASAVAGTNHTTVLTRETGVNSFVGMCVVMGYIYGWTGRKLYQMATKPKAGAMPLVVADDVTMVHDAAQEMDFTLLGRGNQYGAGVWYGDVVATEQSAVYFVGSDGITDVFEFKPASQRPAPIWRLPYGFTGRSICVQNGICFVAGQFGGANTGTDEYGGLYAMDLATRKVFFVGHFRKIQGSSLLMQDMAMSWGSQILVSDTKGKVFVYDMDTDGISLLDDLNDTSNNGTAPTIAFASSESRISALATVGNKRVVAYYDTSGSPDWGAVTYANDELTNRENTGDLAHFVESSQWDFDYPMEAKGLLGFWVTYMVTETDDSGTATTSGLRTDQRITVDYCLDGNPASPTWTTAGTITSLTTPSGAKGRAYLQVAAAGVAPTAPFLNLQVRISVNNTATTGRKCPVVTNVTAEASLVANVESWELVVRVADEPKGLQGRASHREWGGDQIRAYLIALSRTKAAVTFKDGYISHTPGEYNSHTVVIEDVEDSVDRAGEGAMRIKVKTVG